MYVIEDLKNVLIKMKAKIYTNFKAKKITKYKIIYTEF